LPGRQTQVHDDAVDLLKTGFRGMLDESPEIGNLEDGTAGVESQCPLGKANCPWVGIQTKQ
jgi:hypothetical protein